MYKRNLDLSNLKKSFFLWGPRQTGKSYLLRSTFPNSYYVDLLKSDEFVKYQARPHLLREELEVSPPNRIIIIDEIQKVPALLDEIHWLIENRRLQFGLCGSSARKVKRGHANLLGGRALRFELLGLCAKEIGSDFDLLQMLNNGYLPAIYDSESARDSLRSYCSDYLKEEIAAEGVVRNLPNFSHFLETAALSDTEQVNFATIARDTGVSAPTVKTYFEILEDTMLGRFLPPYRFRLKRRMEKSSKFYFFDAGVVSFLCKRGKVEMGSELIGKAFENWVHHELRAYQAYRNPDIELSYWRTSSQIEVDFIVGKMETAIEVKASSRIQSDHLKGLREVFKDYAKLKNRIVICFEKQPRKTSDGIEILPYRTFIERLWSGDFS